MAEPAKLDPPGRGRVYDSIAETIGNTPLVRLHRIAAEAGVGAEVLVKLEFFNPLASVKDRIGVSMIEALEADGAIDAETTIIEPTSGNTGIALAFMCAARGYRLILTMPETMSIERRRMLEILGAELVLTPKEVGLNGAVKKATELNEEIANSVIPNQFANPANPAIHRRTTAEEIWNDTGGNVDAIIMGVGTGGTLTGVAQTLKPRKPDLQIVAFEPEVSQVIAGKDPAPHPMQGIGAPFVPDILDTDQIDEIIAVANDDAFQTARRMAKLEGIPVGMTSGAAIHAALAVAARDAFAGKSVVVVAPSFAERYLSTPLFDDL